MQSDLQINRLQGIIREKSKEEIKIFSLVRKLLYDWEIDVYIFPSQSENAFQVGNENHKENVDYYDG